MCESNVKMGQTKGRGPQYEWSGSQKMIAFRVPKTFHQEARTKARSFGVSLSVAMRTLVELWLKDDILIPMIPPLKLRKAKMEYVLKDSEE